MTGYYKALLTPLVKRNTYGNTIDVSKKLDITNYIKKGGISDVTQKVDSEDFDVGLFYYGDIKIRAVNYNGMFSEASDSRSIFPYTRDLAKLDLIYVDEAGTEFNIFKGLLNEESIKGKEGKFDSDSGGYVDLIFLSLESIFRKAIIKGGLLTDGDSFDLAIKTILQLPTITNVLTFDESKISLNYNNVIDLATNISTANAREALNELLLVSNSIMFIDSDNKINIRSRKENDNTPHMLYGYSDLYGRCNINKIKSYNTGLARCFNDLKINEFRLFSQIGQDYYNLRTKKYEFKFITKQKTLEAIGSTILNEFLYPKEELEVVCTHLKPDFKLLDKVKIDYQLAYKPYNNIGYLPTAGSFKPSDNYKFPSILSSFEIRPDKVFKIIEIIHDLKDLQTTVKLKEIGTKFADSIE